LRRNAYVLASKNQFQSAELVLSRLVELGYESIEDKELLGYVHYELGNYEMCRQVNEELLEIDSENAYASKGLGLALYKDGNIEDGLFHMYRAIYMKKGINAEIHYDLFSVLLDLKREDEARKVRDLAKECSNYSLWQERFDTVLPGGLTS
jgi:tetratricopeptide (TPR) repeat protein